MSDGALYNCWNMPIDTWTTDTWKKAHLRVCLIFFFMRIKGMFDLW